MIDLLPAEDQQALVDSFASVLRDTVPGGSGSCEDFWGRIAGLGWLCLSRPESVGGAGLGHAEEMLVLRECGRFLVTPSFMATLLAIGIADGAGQANLATDLASGKERASLALPRDGATLYAMDSLQSHVLVLADEDGVGLYPNEKAVSMGSSDNLISLSSVPRNAPLASSGETSRARLMVAAQLTGIAEAVRDMAAAYAKTRTQFGQPIGAFQAVKHVCADLAIRADAALAQTSYAALCLAANDAGAEAEVAAAVRIAAAAATEGAEANIQLHGAMGFTEECAAHLFLKRAHLLALFDGGRCWQTKALLEA